ncbi:cell division protein FtsA, partial [Candidatus Parcubacteria bacterium]|nr:cell division protein FtsA [Candidatus Parcubacteria bacterium]
TITGIDIGSSKICTIVASVSEDDISVIGVSSVLSKGIRKGVVVDIDGAVEAIARSLEGAERMAGHAVSRAFVTVSGSHISSQNSHGVVAVSHPGVEITPADVDRVTEAAQAINLPSNREIIHVLPRGYTVDSQDGVRDPVGMSGIRLEVETNIISGSATAMRNLAKCVQQVGVEVEDFVFTGIAAAEATLTDTEKELGTILVDIGGGTTSLVVFSEGQPGYSAVLPMGGQHVTNDLAIGLRTSLENAEKIKLILSEEDQQLRRQVYPQGKDDRVKRGEIDVSALGLEAEAVPKKLLEDIIKARLSEVFHLVNLEVRKSGFEGQLPAGLVLTGGAAQTHGAEAIAKMVLKMPVRVGVPSGVTGLIDEIGGSPHAASVGLVLHARRTPGETRFSFPGGGKVSSIFSKVISWIKSFLP